MGDDGAPGPEDILKILVTSDNHIGYNEKDEVRGTDSFESFEEVLKIAADEKVRTMLALAPAPPGCAAERAAGAGRLHPERRRPLPRQQAQPPHARAPPARPPPRLRSCS